MPAALARSRIPQRPRSPGRERPPVAQPTGVAERPAGTVSAQSLLMRLIDVGNRSLTEPVQYPQGPLVGSPVLRKAVADSTQRRLIHRTRVR
jgi:hypothetical protein